LPGSWVTFEAMTRSPTEPADAPFITRTTRVPSFPSVNALIAALNHATGTMVAVDKDAGTIE